MEASTERGYDDLARSLQTDRMIDIYIGSIVKDTKPYRVQQAVLEELSDYFTRALNKGTFTEGQQGRLHFPEDDKNAWELLLHWAIKRRVPILSGIDRDTRHSLLIRCWVLCDKYQVRVFRNEVMLELVKIFSHDIIAFETVKLGIELTGPGSPLRRLVAEEVMFDLSHTGTTGHPDFSMFDDLDGNNCIGDLLRARVVIEKNKGAFSAKVRFGDSSAATVDEGPKGTLREYMVGDHVPRRAWRWEEMRWTF